MARRQTHRGLRRPVRALLLVVAGLVLAGCYLPVKFDAEIEISRRGFYEMEIDGFFARLPLYAAIRDGGIGALEQRAKVAEVMDDLARDAGVVDHAHYGKGIFRIRYKRRGDLLVDKSVTFLRRNEAMLSLAYSSISRRVTLRGTSVSADNARRLRDIGLTMQGELRLRTDARVGDHNATRVVERDGMTVYVWEINGFRREAPRLAIPF